MGPPVRDYAHHTYGEYRTWDDESRDELIDGIAYAMAPASLRIHQEVAGEIYYQARQKQGPDSPCQVLIAPLDVRLPKAGEAGEADDRGAPLSGRMASPYVIRPSSTSLGCAARRTGWWRCSPPPRRPRPDPQTGRLRAPRPRRAGRRDGHRCDAGSGHPMGGSGGSPS